MNIYPLKKQIKGNTLFLKYPIDYQNKKEVLWYSIDIKYAGFVTDLLDGPLVALLIPAMALGENINIKGSVSEKLFYNLSKSCQILLKQIIPSLKLTNIIPNAIEIKSQRAAGVATGFPCGIDSFSTLADNYFSDVPKGYKITHLLFNNVGSHGKGNERLFEERYEKNKEITKIIGLPFLKINSNVENFYNNFSFQQTVTPRNVSVPLILQGGIGGFLVSSAISYKDIKVEQLPAIARIDTLLLPLLSTKALDIISTGSEYSRVEKTLKVAEIKDSYSSLDVCVDPNSAGNCSKCWKCMRTMLTLDIAGLLDKYQNVFDIPKYHQGKTQYIGKILYDPLFRCDPLVHEIIQYAKDQNYKFPKKSYIIGIFLTIKRWSQKSMKLLRKISHKIKRTLFKI